MTSALVILYFRLNVDIPFWELDLYMAMFGLGLGGCMQTLVLAVQNASPARDMGVVTASSTFFRQLGGTVGTAVFFSILFSTLPDQIKGALTTASQSDPAFQAAVADPAVHANPVNQPFFALAQSTGGSNSNVLSNSAFLQTIDARLAHPILVGFSELDHAGVPRRRVRHRGRVPAGALRQGAAAAHDVGRTGGGDGRSRPHGRCASGGRRGSHRHRDRASGARRASRDGHRRGQWHWQQGRHW